MGELAALERRILKRVGECIQDFGLIEDGDRILVGVSGGKDSLTLLRLLSELQRRAPVEFHLVAAHVGVGLPGFPLAELEAHLASTGTPYVMKQDDIAVVAVRHSKGKSPCSLCSRMRRGALYGLADRLSCNKIALAHHLDDLIETLLMNLFFDGRLGTMPPRLFAKDGRHQVIRPLAYVPEHEIARYAELAGLPVVPKMTCDHRASRERQEAKELVARLARRHPRVRHHALAAMKNVRPEQLLDLDLFDPKA